MIDLGSKKLKTVMGPPSSPTAKIIDNPNQEDFKNARKKKKKQKPFSDLIYLPPRPNENLEVITYGECQPKFVIRKE